MTDRAEQIAGSPPAESVRETAPCKVCGGPAALFGVVDLNEACHESSLGRLPLAGVPVYYRRCSRCGFLFTGHFDAYTAKDFEAGIYNADYAAVDPDFAERRLAANATLIGKLFGGSRERLSLLDYGGGAGKMAEILTREGWSAESYDPFHGSQVAPTGRFDLISCFEVFEHTPDPKSLIGALRALLAEDGLILFSTLLQPTNIEEIRLNWWYAAPRNGHISLFSKQSLAALCRFAGLTLASFNEGLHATFGRLPDFGAHLVADAAKHTRSKA